MKKPDADHELYTHLVGLGVTPRAAGAIGADLHDLADGIAEVQAKLLTNALPGAARWRCVSISWGARRSGLRL
jgi:hypothetical protein